jgi:flavin reductase (DIM6/NTAB) family NADH-FMN oxidoreductase RutF
MGCFATGVTIVTTESEGELYGMTVNSFTSVSMQPPLILICLANGARTTVGVRAKGWFVVNILEQGQKELSSRFAQVGNDRFAGVEFSLNEYGLPALAGCMADVVCRVVRIDSGGDHLIVLGEVVKAEIHDALPLLFFRSSYGALAP